MNHLVMLKYIQINPSELCCVYWQCRVSEHNKQFPVKFPAHVYRKTVKYRCLMSYVLYGCTYWYYEQYFFQ